MSNTPKPPPPPLVEREANDNRRRARERSQIKREQRYARIEYRERAVTKT